MAHHFKKISHTHDVVERASPFTSKGSITLEAALALPIFFFGILSLVYLLEIFSIQTNMKSALYTVSKEQAKDVYLDSILLPSEIEKELVDILGAERLDNSIIADGRKGLDCSGCKIQSSTSIIELSLRYQIEIPVLFFKIPAITCEESVRVKGWTGYEETADWENTSDEMVYITETGIVYHSNPECTYLELSIQLVEKGNIADLRNFNGEKYRACERCMKGEGNAFQVYITNTGNHYHSTVGCSGLKRSIYAVRISEVYGKGGCSRCVD